MNDKGRQLWREVVEHDTLVPPTEEERAVLLTRIRDIGTRLLTWRGSDGEIEMPTISEVSELAADIARHNVRTVLADLMDGRETRSTVIPLDLL